MWSNGWIWIFYHYIKGARQTDQYGFCPSFLSTDPWAIYLPSEADPWVKFPLVYRSVHLFVPTTTSPLSSLYELYRNYLASTAPNTLGYRYQEDTQVHIGGQTQCLDTGSHWNQPPCCLKSTCSTEDFGTFSIHTLWSTLTLHFEKEKDSVMMTNLSEQRQQFSCCSPAVCFLEH